jgi:hypothetical protein
MTEKEKVMAKRTKRNHAGIFQTRVAIKGVKEEKTMVQLSSKQSVHPKPDPTVAVTITG